jgi:hypothetical protein
MSQRVPIHVGVVVDNYDIDATGGGLWTDTTHYKATVPTYKRWWLYGGVVNRDANQTCDVMVYNSANKIVLYLADQAAGTGISHYPDSTLAQVQMPIAIPAGGYVQATFGGAQGAAAYATCYVIEVDAR